MITVAGAYFYVQASEQWEMLASATNSFNRNDVQGAIQSADAILAKNARDVKALVAKANALAQRGIARSSRGRVCTAGDSNC